MSRNWKVAQMGCRAVEKSRNWDVAQIGYHAVEMSRNWDVAQIDVAQMGCRARKKAHEWHFPSSPSGWRQSAYGPAKRSLSLMPLTSRRHTAGPAE